MWEISEIVYSIFRVWLFAVSAVDFLRLFGAAAQPSGSKLPRHKVGVRVRYFGSESARDGGSTADISALTHCYREQARSHSGSLVFAISGYTTQPCGSELARDDGSTANITGAEPPLSRASSHMGGV